MSTGMMQKKRNPFVNRHVYKVDKRFALYNHGFTHFVEFVINEYDEMQRLENLCTKILGDRLYYSGSTVYHDGKWTEQYHIKRSSKTGSIFGAKYRYFFKSKKNYMLVLLASD